MKAYRFVHLNVHSHYSINDGCASIKELVDAAIKDGMPGIAFSTMSVRLTSKDRRRARSLLKPSSGVSCMWLRMDQRTKKMVTRI